MGNEQSQEAAPEPQPASDQEDDFDLSAIPDTRRNHSSPNPTSASPPPTSTMSRKRKKGKTRANSKKKRKQSRDEQDNESTAEPEPEPEPQPEPGAQSDDEETRLAEEILLREQSQRIREKEPEMFGVYAESDDSEPDAQATTRDPKEEETLSPEADGQAEDLVDTTTRPDTHELDGPTAVEPHDGSEDEDGKPPQEDAHLNPVVEDGSDANDSGFDEQPEQAVVEETPLPKHGKRKRPDDESPASSKQPKSSKKQKKNRLPASPDLGDHGDVDETVPEATVTRESKKSRRRQSNMEHYTQPFTKGSDLRHPVYNPESPEANRERQEVEVVIPMSTADLSKNPEYEDARPPSADVAGPSSSKPRSSGLKRRPKGPLSSPVTKGEKRARKDQWDIHAQPDAHLPNGVATSTARRTHEGEDEESGSEYDHLGKQRKKKGKASATRASKSRSSTPATKRGPHTHRCPICNSTFPSEKALEKHRADPIAHDHLIDCDKCDEQFASRAALARHQKEKGHGTGNGLQGKTGQFTTDEVNKIDRWRRQFCNEHEINKYEFNEMMAASGKLGNSQWPWKFIGKREFVQEYYDVLPERNVRSMRRYRANFTNVDRSREFTAQDDADILSLVDQLGQKWAEIGEQLTRDPEIVRQRWKNKLMLERQGKKISTGPWDDVEQKRFTDAVKEIRRMTISAGFEDVDTFNWTAVSAKVKTRSAQQCANHWRAMHGKNVKGQWVDSGLSQIMKTKSPSKMERRLAGHNLSKSRIENSDDEANDNGNDSEREDEDAAEASESEAQKIEEDDEATRSDSGAEAQNEANPPTAETPHKGRKSPYGQDKTPANGLSASQAFEQTQAHTSTLKKSAKRGKRSTPSQEQPTPGIPVQVRPERSPEFGKKLDEVLRDQDSDADESAPEEEDQSSPDDEEPVVEDEAEEGSEDDTQSASEEAAESDSEVPEASGAEEEANNAGFTAVNGRKRSVSTSEGDEAGADRISKIFKNAASPNKKDDRKRRKKAQKAKGYHWPEESQSQSDVESESEGLGIDNLPR